MKLEVYNQKIEPEKTLYFKLRKQDNNVVLTVVDKNGDRRVSGDILSINEKGVCLYSHINKDFGLPLGKDGKIVVYDK